MSLHKVNNWLAALAVLVASYAAAEPKFDLGGRSSLQGLYSRFPDNSLFRDLAGGDSQDVNAEVRLVGSAAMDNWDFKADYQLLALYGERIQYTRDLPGLTALFGRLPNDDRRLFNLTDTIRDKNKFALLQRLDRLSVGYTGDNTVIRLGRQALSWGNGLVYTPFDIVNPFDPTAVDTEYKTGDDILYGQYLRASGDDVQTAIVARRDPLTGDVESDQFTYAAKYHGLLPGAEYDILLARNYGDPLLAVGGNRELGGAVWRADLVLSDTDLDGTVAQFVTNLSYSWVWAGKNVSGLVEYFYNGFGQTDGCYSPVCLAGNPELLARVARRELFTLGRNYVVTSVSFELTPLFTITPNVFVNAGDGSALLQFNTRNDLAESLILLGSLGVPLGSSGTEFGGIDSGAAGRYLSQEFSIFVQLNWYY